MRVVDLYFVLDEDVEVLILDNKDGHVVKACSPSYIPVCILDARVVSIKPATKKSIYDIIIEIER